jgi:hypothetical protein
MIVRRTVTCSLFIAHKCMTVIWIVTCWSVEGLDDVTRDVPLKAEKKKWKWFASRMLPNFCKGIVFIWNDSTLHPFIFLFKSSCEEFRSIRLNYIKNPIRNSQKTLQLPYKGQSVNAVVAYSSCYLSESHKMHTHKVRAKCSVVTSQKATRIGWFRRKGQYCGRWYYRSLWDKKIHKNVLILSGYRDAAVWIRLFSWRYNPM